jgi:hypothetical protein
LRDGIADMAWFILGFAQHGPYAGAQLPGLPFRTAEQGSELSWKMYENPRRLADIEAIIYTAYEPTDRKAG